MAGSILEQHCRDLLVEANVLDPVSGRDKEIETVIGILSRKSKGNVILIGEPGVGKTAIIEGLSQRIVEGAVPINLKDVKVYALEVGELLAGTKFRGEFEEKLHKIMAEVQASRGKVVMFIDEIHLALGAGRVEGGNLDVANLLKPYLAREDSKFIGATTTDEYIKYVSEDAAFARRFQKVMVGEPSVRDTITILRRLKTSYETHHKVRIRDSAVVAAVEYSNRYMKARFLPDKAIDLVDEACALLRMELDSHPEEITNVNSNIAYLEVEASALKYEMDGTSKARLIQTRKEIADLKSKLGILSDEHEVDKRKLEELRFFRDRGEKLIVDKEEAERRNDMQAVYKSNEELKTNVEFITNLEKSLIVTDSVGAEQIAKVVSRHTGIPVTSIGTDEKKRLMRLAESLHQKVVGQEQAVTAVVEVVQRSRTGLGRPNQPIGSFLFTGPTGVGKTELAKALAEELFGDEKFILRLDMSEYMDSGSVARLIGSRHGNSGHSFHGGLLTEPVMLKPYSVILLDEIEKAHKSVHNLLLQLLDEGRLTNSQGRRVDFNNTVIILTSNLGAEHLVDASKTMETARSMVIKAVKNYFKPELVNRFDEIVIFHPLSRDNMRQIGKLLLKDVVTRMDTQGIVLQVTEGAVDYILDKTFHQEDGARPIIRLIEKEIVTQISRMVLSDVIAANKCVLVDHTSEEGGKLTYEVNQVD